MSQQIAKSIHQVSIIVVSHTTVKNNREITTYTLYPVFPNGNILQNCNVISQTKYWHWYNQDTGFPSQDSIPYSLTPGNHVIYSLFLQFCYF